MFQAPPVGVLLIHTDLVSSVGRLMIHETITSPSRSQPVSSRQSSSEPASRSEPTPLRQSSPQPSHTYPPRPQPARQQPVPADPLLPPDALSRKKLGEHPEWKEGDDMAETIRLAVKMLSEKYLDESQSYKFQDPNAREAIKKALVKMHPVLNKYQDHWPADCLVMAHLHYTSGQFKKVNRHDVVRKMKKVLRSHTRTQRVPVQKVRFEHEESDGESEVESEESDEE